MSFLLMAQAMKIKTGSPSTKWVLVKLADFANENTGECFPSIQTIADQCEMSTRSVRNQIAKLIELGLLQRINRFSGGKQVSNAYRLHLDSGVQILHGGGAKNAQEGCKKCTLGMHHLPTEPIKDPIKEPIKDPMSENKFSDDDFKCAEWILERVLRITPRAEPDLNKWADVIRLMRTRNKLTHREISKVFDFANRNSFWQTNILSPSKLREKFSQLEAKMNQEGHSNERSTHRQTPEQFEEQSQYPEEIQLCSSDSKAVREFKLAYQQEFRESLGADVLATGYGNLSGQMDNDQRLEGECGLANSDFQSGGERLSEID
ncbi:helix-turn-helix domain-containing protein [Vibrio crassostreae]|uniref:helix-turn-helix domain-containing protein n=1 Tax=Vibrio crassostreae TaxID=246167 RepID=UPI00105315FC|nr:helix-turn-helix domain-containing protein [Vibrio crassostreae]